MTSRTAARAPFEPILKQHGHEVSARWSRRAASASAADVRFEQRLRDDRALLAHIDALRIAGAAALPLVERHCPDDTPGDLFARQLAALLAGAASGMAPDATLDGAACAAVRHAAAWLNDDELQDILPPCLATTDRRAASAALARAASLRLPIASAVERALGDRDASFRLVACEAAGAGTSELLPAMREALQDSDAGVSAAAARAAFRLGDRDASIEVLVRHIDAAPPAASDAFLLLVAGLPVADSRGWLNREVARGLSAAELVAAVEVSSDPAHVGWLCGLLDHDGLAPAARTALATLTGIDLAVDDAAAEVPVGASAARRRLETTPLPGDQERRWLGGELLGEAAVFDALLHGPLRLRRFAALHLGLSAPWLPLLDVDAPAPRQLAWMTDDENALTEAAHG